jgi:hypothetical protein
MPSIASKFRLIIIFVMSGLIAGPRLAVGAIMLGQIDDFQDGTTQNWNGAAPSPLNISTGGPAGSGDRFLEVESGSFGGGPRLLTFNDTQWTGDFVTAGVDEVAMDLENFGTESLSIRIALRQSSVSAGSPGYVSTNAFSLAADGNWHHATFLIDAADLTGLNGAGPLSTFLTSISDFRLLSASSPALVGDPISGQFGVDNIQALGVPEPSGILAAVLGIACLTGFARRARSSVS